MKIAFREHAGNAGGNSRFNYLVFNEMILFPGICLFRKNRRNLQHHFTLRTS